MPDRIQRRRTKGYRHPPGTVMCTRPGRWGNPYRVVRDFEGCWCVVGRVLWVEFGPGEDGRLAATEEAVRCYRGYVQARPELVAAIRAELAGAKHLACTCGLGDPCHVDVILEVLATPAGEEWRCPREMDQI